MNDVASLSVALGIVSAIAIVALYTVGQLEREVRRLKRRGRDEG